MEPPAVGSDASDDRDRSDDPTGLSPESRRALEAIVMVAADPVPPQMLAQLLEVGIDRVESACEALAAAYEAQGRGFVLARVAGGYRFQSHPDAAPYVERYITEGQSARLSSAALETLAIVAYKQPLSRAQVAAIRGVNVDGVMRTLAHRGLIAEVARDPGPGQAILFGTTPLFLERLGLDGLDDLPPIAAFVPGADVVEALEKGLRVEDPTADAPPASGPSPEVGGPSDATPPPTPQPSAAQPVDPPPSAAQPVEPQPGDEVDSGETDLDLTSLGDVQDWEHDRDLDVHDEPDLPGDPGDRSA